MKTSKYLIGIGGKANSGKDLIGRIIQYLTSGAEEKHTFEEYEESFSKFGTTLQYLPNWEIKKFADKLKDIVCLLIGCTRKELEDRKFKEKVLGEEWDIKIITYIDGELHKIYNPSDYEDFDIKCKYPISYTSNVIKQTPRSLLQKIGTDLFRNQLHPNTWVNATFANYKPIYQEIKTSKEKIGGDGLLKDFPKCEQSLIYPTWIITDCRFPNELEAIKKHNGITIRINRGLVERTGKMIQGPEHISETALDNAEFDYVIENDCTIDDLIEKVREILIKENIIND